MEFQDPQLSICSQCDLEYEHLYNLRIQGKEHCTGVTCATKQCQWINVLNSHMALYRAGEILFYVNCAFLFRGMSDLKTHNNFQHFKNIQMLHIFGQLCIITVSWKCTWISFFNHLSCYGSKVTTHTDLYSLHEYSRRMES